MIIFLLIRYKEKLKYKKTLINIKLKIRKNIKWLRLKKCYKKIKLKMSKKQYLKIEDYTKEKEDKRNKDRKKAKDEQEYGNKLKINIKNITEWLNKAI